MKTRPRLNGARLVNADLTWAYLIGVNLTRTDLTEANFSGANLGGADLGGANLKRANLKKVDFFEADLSGADLSRANLRKANLKRAYLNRANLNGADLSESDLSLAHAIQANFTQTRLTGVCLEDWNINSTTNLNEVICEYVYLKRNQQERFPIDRNFVSGEFTKLFQKASSIIELIFHNGVDWIAFSFAYGKLRIENEDAEIAVQSIENKGDGIVVVQVSVSPNANKLKLYGDFMQGYEFACKVLEDKYRAELSSKDARIVQYRRENQRQGEQINSLFSVLQLLATTPKSITNITDQRGSSFGVGVNQGGINAENFSGIHNESPDPE